MRTTFRILLGLMFTALVVTLAAWGGLSLYLRSESAQRRAATEISLAIGLPVTVESLDVGTSETSARLRLLEPNDGGPPRELGTIESARADVSLIDLATGTAHPGMIELRNMTVTLRLDRDGKLLTAIPSPQAGSGTSPRLHITDATIVIRQDGRPDFALHFAHLHAMPREGQYDLQGEIEDERWKSWRVRGTFDIAGFRGQLHLDTERGPLDLELLRSIPFVPPETWQHVQPRGETAAAIQFRFDDAFHYDVRFTPTGRADLTLSDLDAPLNGVQGTIRIADEKVRLEQCRAHLAGGDVRVEGVLDFTTVSKLTLQVVAEGLDVTKLPASWSLPPQVSGRLRGRADLVLEENAAGTLEPRGGGEGTIEDAKIAGLPAEIKLRLRSDGRRYRFESEEAANGESPVVFLLPPPPEPKPESTLDATITLRDVDVAELLRQLETEIPYKLAGQVTVQVKVSVPVGGVVDRTAYRFRGTLTATAFSFEGLKVQDVRAEVAYRDGVFKLTTFSARIPQASGPAGTLQGQAQAGIEPRGDVTATLALSNIPLKELAQALPKLKLDADGTVNGQADLTAPLNTLDDLSTWRGTANLSADTISAFGHDLEKLQARARLDRGTAILSEMKVRLFRGSLRGTAQVPLIPSRTGEFALDFEDLDSAAATKAIPGFPVPLAGLVTGRLTAKTAAVQNDQPRTIEAEVDLRAPKLQVRGIPAERLTGRITVADRRAEYTLNGHILGGTFEIEGRYPALDSAPGMMRLQRADLHRSAAALRIPWLEPLRGQVSANFHHGAENGTGRIGIENLAWGSQRWAESLTGRIELNGSTLDLRDFNGRFAEGRLQARARYDLKDPRRNFYNITLDRASAKALTVVLPEALQGQDVPMTLSARGQLGSTSRVTLSAATITLGGIPVTQLDLPLEWSGRLEQGELRIRNGVARLGNGKITADAAYTLGPASRLHGTLQFHDVQLRGLLGSGAAILGNGRVSGRFVFAGESVRTLDDVNGTLTLMLNQTSVREVPLLRVITPYLSPAGLVQPFDAGEVKGRLAKGIFRLERFALSNAGAQVFAEGTITLAGRVHLEVIAVTGQVGPNTRLLSLVGVNLGAVGPLPLSVVQKVSDLLSNRMIRLTITGTVTAPVVRINKAALLTDTAVRFFLGHYVLPESLNAVR